MAHTVKTSKNCDEEVLLLPDSPDVPQRPDCGLAADLSHRTIASQSILPYINQVCDARDMLVSEVVGDSHTSSLCPS